MKNSTESTSMWYEQASFEPTEAFPVMNSTSSIFGPSRPLIETSLITFAIVIIAVVTIAGNGLILIAIGLQPRLHSISNYFIVSLSTADLVVGIGVMPLMATYTLQKQWKYGQWGCDIWVCVDFLSSTASFLTLCVMSIDRYWAITSPYVHMRKRTRRRTVLMISVAWILPLITWIPSVFIYRYLYGPPPINECNYAAPPSHMLGLCVVLYYIPILFMTVCYTRVIIRIRGLENSLQFGNGSLPLIPSDTTTKRSPESLNRNQSAIIKPDDNSYLSVGTIDPQSYVLTYNHHRHEYLSRISLSRDEQLSLKGYTRKVATNTQAHCYNMRVRKNRRAARMLGMLLLFCLVCWVPWGIVWPLWRYRPDLIPSLLFETIWWLGYCNSCLNPFLYMYSSKNFRKAVRSMLTGKVRCCACCN